MSQRLLLPRLLLALFALLAPLCCLGFVPKAPKGANASPQLETEKANDHSSGGNGPSEVRPVLPRYVFFMLQAHQGPGRKGQHISDAYQRFHIDPYILIFGKRPYFATADGVWTKKKRLAASSDGRGMMNRDSYQTRNNNSGFPYQVSVDRRPYRAGLRLDQNGVIIYPHRGRMNAYQKAMNPYRDTVYPYQKGLASNVDTTDLRKDSVFMIDGLDPAVPTSSNVSSDSDTQGNGSLRLDKRKGAPAIPVAANIPRHPRSRKRYDVPQIECPTTPDGSERFACPSADNFNRYRCIDDHGLCDGFIDCPKGEDEDMRSCMFYKTTKAHLDVLADALLRWARGRY